MNDDIDNAMDAVAVRIMTQRFPRITDQVCIHICKMLVKYELNVGPATDILPLRTDDAVVFFVVPPEKTATQIIDGVIAGLDKLKTALAAGTN